MIKDNYPALEYWARKQDKVLSETIQLVRKAVTTSALLSEIGEGATSAQEDAFVAAINGKKDEYLAADTELRSVWSAVDVVSVPSEGS